MKNQTDRLAGSVERNPDYVYEETPPEVDEMRCPEEQYLSCCEWMDRGEMLGHYLSFHKEYGATDMEAIEVIFEQERSRRYQR
jgi:hypothetical protein